MRPSFGILGGSGFYEIKGLEEVETLEISTPFGPPSAPVITGLLSGKPVAFISRHGNGHQFLASEICYRANIYALKSLGVDRLVSISAFQSLRSDFEPGHLVIPDQLLDFTTTRSRTFFGEGFVARINATVPHFAHTCQRKCIRRPSRPKLWYTWRNPAHRGWAAYGHNCRIGPVPGMGRFCHEYHHLPGGFSGPGSRNVLRCAGARNPL